MTDATSQVSLPWPRPVPPRPGAALGATSRSSRVRVWDQQQEDQMSARPEPQNSMAPPAECRGSPVEQEVDSGQASSFWEIWTRELVRRLPRGSFCTPVLVLN